MRNTNKALKYIALILVLITFILLGFFSHDFYYREQQSEMLSMFLHSQFHTPAQIAELDALDPSTLALGAKEMLNHKIAIVGITRDNLREFAMMRASLEMVGKAFQDYRIILFENDSTDGTKEALALWQRHNTRVKVISHDYHHKKRPSIKFLADARNHYIKELKNAEYQDFDIVMMIDMDMEFGIDIRAIQNSFAKVSEWDMVCSNGLKDNQMWDAFAFRSEQYPYGPKEYRRICDADKNDPKWGQICHNGSPYWNNVVPSIQRAYDISDPLVPVHSCFGGMAFYKKDFISGCMYDSIKGDCEHVPFHECVRLKNNGRLMMNPAQVVKYNE